MSPLTRFRTALGFGAQVAATAAPEPYRRPGGPEHQALLAEINADVPPDVDWTAGALDYVAAEIRKHGHDAYTHYLLTKPFGPINLGEAGQADWAENVHYLYNFVNLFHFLNLPGGSVVLDVACGSGWVSQFFARMGYVAHGFDLCPDMVELTRRRLREDAQLATLHPLLEQSFFPLDIEKQELPAPLHGTVGAVVLESCLHHFVDPVTALSHLADGLSPDGLMLVIEGENRQGPLNPHYLQVMRDFDTLERPYTRSQMTRMLHLAGLPHHCFLGRLNGWFTPDDPALAHVAQRVHTDADALNLVVCARTPEALRRVVPHYTPA